jgi:hypothetical protein
MDTASNGPTVRGPRRPRISLRAMLVVVLFLGCSLGRFVHRARVQRAAVDSVERVRGEVLYEWEYKDGKYIPGGRPWWPRWLVSALGVDSDRDSASPGKVNRSSMCTLLRKPRRSS